MKKFKIGIRFQPIGQDTTSEADIVKSHWAIVVTPVDKPNWSQRVELATWNDVLFFPATIVEKEVQAHPLGIWTGYLEDIHKMMEVHPMRHTSYSVAYNNCQHWAATLLVFLQAFASTTTGRRFDIEYTARYNRALSVLQVDGNSLYHVPNSKLASVHLAGMGGGAAAVGAAAVAAEATVLVPASGLAGWFGATVAVPTAGAAIATAALPFTVGVAAIAGGTYLYKNYSWKSSTKFSDPRKTGCPRNGNSLSATEKGENLGKNGVPKGSLLGVTGSSTASLSGPSGLTLLGSYAGVQAGAVSAAFSPGAAAIYAPSAAATLTMGIFGSSRWFS